MYVNPLSTSLVRRYASLPDSTIVAVTQVGRLEFTHFCGDPKQSGSPISFAEATGLREPSAEKDGN
jgi:hypothetical protein